MNRTILSSACQVMLNIRNDQIVKAHDKELASFLVKDKAKESGKTDMFGRLSCYLPGPEGSQQKVLELGCGPGKYVALLTSLGYRVVGVDPFTFPQWDLFNEITSCELLKDVVAEELPFEDNYFDHIVCLGALLYFDNPRVAVGEMKRVIKPGGKMIIRSVNKDNQYTKNTGRKLDPASKNLYTLSDLKSLFQDGGFLIQDSYSYGYFPSRYPDFWWYLASVWIPHFVHDILSHRLNPEHRVNNIIYASSE